MKEITIVRTNRSGKVIPSQHVCARRLSKGIWEIREDSQGWNIEPDKLYHPMSEYFAHPSVATFIKCKLRINWWKFRFKQTLGKFNTDGYGAYLSNDRYYFQFRKEEYKKMVSHIKEEMKNEVKVFVSEKK